MAKIHYGVKLDIFKITNPICHTPVDSRELDVADMEIAELCSFISEDRNTLCRLWACPRLSVQCRRPQAGDVEQKNAVQP